MAMSLTDRIAARLCREPGCKRTPAGEGHAFCDAHRPRWTPEWRKHLTARDETWRTAA